MLLIDLLNKIKSSETDLPYEIEYNGIRYIKEKYNYTYYEKGKQEYETMKIDTFNLDEEIKIINETNKLNEINEIKQKINEIIEEINNLED